MSNVGSNARFSVFRVTLSSVMAFSAALFSASLALAVLLRTTRSFARWCFFAGMAGLALESILSALSLQSLDLRSAAFFNFLVLLTGSLLPAFWLAFSLTYSRGNYREFLKRWKFVLAAALIVPIGISVTLRSELLHILGLNEADYGWIFTFGSAGKALNVISLVTTVMILSNLEKTFRSSVGTTRWRIKFVLLGLAVIFAGRLYVLSQNVLFSAFDPALQDVESGAILIGCAFVTIAYLRDGLGEIDVYPSQSVLQHSVTVLLVGGYLFLVGVLAQLIAFLGTGSGFRSEALVVLLGTSLLAVLLLSERLRQRIQYFVSRHFKRPQHDFRKTWHLFTHEMSGLLDPGAVCSTAARLISENFHALSVTAWRVEEQKETLVFGASTTPTVDKTLELPWRTVVHSDPGRMSQPFNLDESKGQLAEALQRVTATQFRGGGSRICVPLCAGNRWLGCVILADRVNGLPYTIEELDLLNCIGDQVAATLLNLRLTAELMLAKELEAFQTMSAFFVHDLKNAASSLDLTLQNLPMHFDDPEFRRDALRGIANTVERINRQISRLGILRNKLDLRPVESDLNQLITETLANLDGLPGARLVQELRPVPKVFVDPEQIQSVVANLLLNAREAVGSEGQICVETSRRAGRAALSVTDNGCGMSEDFLRNSLFRPFQTTKKKGFGIGMFQSKMIVEAHQGSIQVESEPGKGTRFDVFLPLAAARSPKTPEQTVLPAGR